MINFKVHFLTLVRQKQTLYEPLENQKIYEILNQMKIRKHIKFEKYGRLMNYAKMFYLCEINFNLNSCTH